MDELKPATGVEGEAEAASLAATAAPAAPAAPAKPAVTAPVQPKTPAAASKATKTTYVVKSQFRDIGDFSLVHNEGTDVSHFDSERLKNLVELGLVVKK
jgi:hypothetical protein